MIAVDTNILVYAHRADSHWHAAADRTLASLAEGSCLWAIPWPCLNEFVAIVTHPRVYSPSTPLPVALEQVESWLESPTLTLLSEGEGYAGVWAEVLRKSAVSGGAVHDARIAALCIHHGIKKLLSADRDFSRFPALKTENPLAG
jgi:hypothetical protein